MLIDMLVIVDLSAWMENIDYILDLYQVRSLASCIFLRCLRRVWAVFTIRSTVIRYHWADNLF